jgi:cyclopropane fatty-acyl-phospholipid synthase-like methyltransferase
MTIALETLTTCPICGSPQIARKRIRVSYAICQDCGQVFVNPRMTDAATVEYYRGAYRDEVTPNEREIAVDAVRQESRARMQIALLGEWLKEAHTCLEIGCGRGYLVNALHECYGMDCVGVEPDQRSREREPARGLVVYADIRDVPPRAFDLITMSHSLEHMNHPVEYLRRIIDNYTGEHTRIMVEVPNLDVVQNTLSLHHPFGFTDHTLKGVMHRVGYRPLHLTTHGLGSARALYLLGIFGRKTK